MCRNTILLEDHSTSWRWSRTNKKESPLYELWLDLYRRGISSRAARRQSSKWHGHRVRKGYHASNQSKPCILLLLLIQKFLIRQKLQFQSRAWVNRRRREHHTLLGCKQWKTYEQVISIYLRLLINIDIIASMISFW